VGVSPRPASTTPQVELGDRAGLDGHAVRAGLAVHPYRVTARRERVEDRREGRVIAEWMQEQSLPQGIRKGREDFTELARTFKQLNAPKGRLGRASLVWSNRSITSNDKVYASYLKRIAQITEERNELAGKIKTALNNAAFHNQAVGEFTEIDLNIRAKLLIDQVEDLAGRD